MKKEVKFGLQLFRAVLVPIYCFALGPVAFVLGELCEKYFNFWSYYFAAFSIPVFGLVGSYFISPISRFGYTVGVFFVGCFLAYVVIFESYYPGWHQLAYSVTNKQFFITIGVASITLLLIGFYHKRYST
ncbi:hypothetical protein KCM76_06755 [Zooshikella marina]|uniref:hypothetical protein n=1 Tax=Zooshikella ganghwensis TaxID=202772 RepID=UPI001BAFB3C3|nr:hypothetical protein [Zooshikella ganghwensis]MBU2705673.1 hypothetical protein [Zooshikella ganghwensis]